MKIQHNLLSMAFAAVIGAVAAVGTLKALDGREEVGGQEGSVGSVVGSDDGRPVAGALRGGVPPEQLIALQRRVRQLELRDRAATAVTDRGSEPFDDASDPVVSPGLVTMTREGAIRAVHQEFDRQLEQHHAEPVNAEWRARTEALVIQQAEALAGALSLEFREVSCRSSTCIVEFTAPDDETRSETQGQLAIADFGEGCAKFVVAFPDEDPAATQTVRMIVDCSQP